MIGYSDADWAGNTANSKRSTSGYVFVLAGAAISWISKRQNIVALSSTESEYIAAISAAQEALFLRQLLQQIAPSPTTPTLLLLDNQGALKLAEGTGTSKRTKHIDIRYHFIREAVANGSIKCQYIPTADMVADTLTRPVGCPILMRNLQIMLGHP